MQKHIHTGTRGVQFIVYTLAHPRTLPSLSPPLPRFRSHDKRTAVHAQKKNEKQYIVIFEAPLAHRRARLSRSKPPPKTPSRH